MSLDPLSQGLTQWQGGALSNGAKVVFRSTLAECLFAQDPDYGMKPYSGFLGLVPYRFNASVPQYDYVCADIAAPGEDFTVTTWARGSRESLGGMGITNYQKLILNASNGNYLSIDEAGYYIASASQENARVFILDLDHGNQTQLFDGGYTYGQRTSIEPGLEMMRLATAQCTKINDMRLMFWNYQYGGVGGNAMLEVFLQTSARPLIAHHRDLTTRL